MERRCWGTSPSSLPTSASTGRGRTLAWLTLQACQCSEGITLAPQTQARILKQMSQFLDWCVGEGELGANPWEALKVKDRPEVHPHGVLTDRQVSVLLAAKDRVLHSALLFGLLTGMRSGRFVGSWRRTSQQRATWGGLSASGRTR